MAKVRFFSGETVPLEMHKVRIVQKLFLPPVDERLKCATAAGNNTFLLQNNDVFLDMLTDSGVNAMSDRQLAAMMVADDSYAGSATYTRLESKLREIFGIEYFLPAHQGRAAENIIGAGLRDPGLHRADELPLHDHQGAHRAQRRHRRGDLRRRGAGDHERPTRSRATWTSPSSRRSSPRTAPRRSPSCAWRPAPTSSAASRSRSRTCREVRRVCDEHGLLLVLDASLLADNLYFIKTREESCRDLSIREITREIADLCDIIYFSARKLGCARGGGICIKSEELYRSMRDLVPLYEGFLTYGGMSVREIEAMTVGLEETMDEDMISQGPQFIEYMVDELVEAGRAGDHAGRRPRLPRRRHAVPRPRAADAVPGRGARPRRSTSPAASAAWSAARSPSSATPTATRRSPTWNSLRLALPRRVFTLSQVKYAVDRIAWLYENRELVGGLEFVEEPRDPALLLRHA